MTVKNQMIRGYCAFPKREMRGQTKNLAYKCWENMVQRCTNPKFTDYCNYGGRGIKLHPTFISFKSFIETIGPRPSMKHSIDRIDVNGHYEPGNVRWATSIEQANNTRAGMRKGHIYLHGRKFRAQFGDHHLGSYSSREEAEEAIMNFKVVTGRPL